MSCFWLGIYLRWNTDKDSAVLIIHTLNVSQLIMIERAVMGRARARERDITVYFSIKSFQCDRIHHSVRNRTRCVSSVQGLINTRSRTDSHREEP